MKNSLLMLLVLALVSFSSQAQSDTKKKSTFKVYGNCGMCKSKIEGAVKGKAGIYVASWDTKSKKMSITYNPKKTTLAAIKQKIADAGYDSESHRAKKATYDKLHGCCKYERPKS
jgi:copper chaperone CopZ